MSADLGSSGEATPPSRSSSVMTPDSRDDEDKIRLYCFCLSDGKDGRFMIQCDGCKEWYHGECVVPILTVDDVQYLQKYFCKLCEPTRGKSVYVEPTRKSKRDRTQVNYNELHQGLAVEELRFTKVLRARTFAKDRFQRMKGHEVTIDWARKSGLREPVVVPTPEGLGMKMPANTLSVRDVAKICGPEREVDVIEVSTQSERSMTLNQWADYFEKSPAARGRILNVISLEFSETQLASQVVRPRLVREIDWTDNFWPHSLKARNDYPHVQLYCLMSVKDSYTDFHIDFGGSSVFYHLLAGKKVFYFIEPTKNNLKKYEKWSSSPEQSNTFLGDEIRDGAIEVHLEAGNTMIIPTGWIHAVYTPADSMVIGGNFLQGLNIRGQLAIQEVEKRTLVPAKFRFPFFDKMQWYAAKNYLRLLRARPMTLSNWELDGVDELINYLQDIASKVSDVNNVSKEDRKAIKRSIPPKVKNVQKLLRQLRKHLTAAQQLLSESKEKIVSNGSSDSKPVPSVTADPLPINTVESNPPTAPLPAATVQIPTLPPANQPGADAEDSDDWLSDLTEMEFLDSDVGSQRDDWTTDDSSDGSDDSEMDHTDMYLPNPKHAVKVKGKRRRHEKDKANGGVERVKRPRVKDDEDDDAPSSAALSRERTKSLSHERTKSLSHERTKSLSPNDQIPQIPRHTSLRPTLSLEPKLERPLVNPAPPKPVFKPSATIYQPYPPRVSASPGIVVPSASSTIVGPSASPTIVGPEAGTPMNPVFANPSAVPVPPKEKEKKPAVYSRLMKTMTKMSKRR